MEVGQGPNWGCSAKGKKSTSNYSAIANSHTQEFTTTRTKSSQSVVPSQVVVW
jgi:hypothetical protein